MLHAKNYYNRPMLHGAIQKIKVAHFMDHGVYTHSAIVCFLQMEGQADRQTDGRRDGLWNKQRV